MSGSPAPLPFDRLCSRCATADPSKSWTVQRYHSDGKRSVLRPCFSVRVCGSCFWKLQLVKRWSDWLNTVGFLIAVPGGLLFSALLVLSKDSSNRIPPSAEPFLIGVFAIAAGGAFLAIAGMIGRFLFLPVIMDRFVSEGIQGLLTFRNQTVRQAYERRYFSSCACMSRSWWKGGI